MNINKITLNDVTISGKRVLTRVDFNVPLKNGIISDDTRIRAALPTIKHIISQGGRLILMSHLGRPDGERKDEYSLKPVATYLEELLNLHVEFINDCVGASVREQVMKLQNGQVALLENVRFHPEEELLNTASRMGKPRDG